MGVGIGIGLTGLGMTSAVGRNPGAFTQVSCTEFSPSR
jgi:F0F1-type ATP synthase membrane subunit c/vacuolar-type H+-ATPase subunit K